MSIGERLKEWRKENRLTTIEINNRTGIPTGLLSEYENDKKAIGSKNLISLYEEFRIDINWLLTGDKNENLLTDEEYQLIQYFRKCDKKTKEQILNFILFCFANNENAITEDKGKSSECKTG